jgi:hypothetical protein
MKTLTIKQPWANLIAHGIKDIENRTWKTNYRGKVLIHAGASHMEQPWCYSPKQINFLLKNHEGFKRGENSAIIGEVEIIDCVRDHSSIWAEKHCYNWVLANAVLYDQPILNVKGKLSFWEYEK